MTQAPEFDVVVEGLAFPEGPVVMADGSVIVMEIATGRITRCWDGRKETVADVGGGPNGAAIGPDGALYVCNNGGMETNPLQHAAEAGWIERVDLATGKSDRLYEECGEHRLSAPNDIVFDASGNMWFTDLGKTRERQRAMSGLYFAAPDGSNIVEVHHGGAGYNGVGLSPDGATVYVADTLQARLYRFPARPERSRPELVATIPGHVDLDSLAVTAAGNVCVARLHKGGIATVTPDGQVSAVPFPDQYTTNIAFGGEDMRTAWITQSMSGQLIRTRWAEPGLRLNFNA
jgi:gluconolactonase